MGGVIFAPFTWEKIEIKLTAELVFTFYYYFLWAFCKYSCYTIKQNHKNCNIWQRLRTAHDWSNSSPGIERARGSITLEAAFRNMGNNEGAKYRHIQQHSLSLSDCWRPWIYFSAGQSPWVYTRANTAVVSVQECERCYVTKTKARALKYLIMSSLSTLKSFWEKSK